MNKVFLTRMQPYLILQITQQLCFGGFGLCGIPENLIDALKRKSRMTALTCISNNAGVDDFGLGLLLKTRQIKKMMRSYVWGGMHEFVTITFRVSLKLILHHKVRSPTRIQMAAMGIPAFFTTAGSMELKYAEGNERVRVFRIINLISMEYAHTCRFCFE